MRRRSITLPFHGLLALASACGNGGETAPPSSESGGHAGNGPSGGDSGGGSGGRPGVGSSGAGGSRSGGESGTATGAAWSGGGSAGGTGGAGAGSTGADGGAGGGAAGAASGGSVAMGDCTFSLVTNEISPQMATVGVVEWEVDGSATEARIVFELQGAAEGILNRGGEAPVDLEKDGHRTLLLGLKQESNYGFTIEATVDGKPCVSPRYSLPPTGTLDGAPVFSRNVEAPEAVEPGFLILTAGYRGNPDSDSKAFILDADGTVVWLAAAPPDAARAKMDYEGQNMWMLALNFDGGLGEMRYLSMDGQTGQNDVPKLEAAHHDFTVMPGGKVATMGWAEVSFEGPESELLIRSPDGTVETAFTIGENLYVEANDRFHPNAIHYIEHEDGFTISDRYASTIVNVSSAGELRWQLGGSCDGAPAGADRCSAQSWTGNHGHHLLADGSFLLFNNSPRDGREGSSVLEFEIQLVDDILTTTLVEDYPGTAQTGILGDVQRLPRGNTLITYSEADLVVEVDAEWEVVQSFAGEIGYVDWRPTLYGPPARL